MDAYLPLAILLAMAAVALAVSERNRRRAFVGYVGDVGFPGRWGAAAVLARTEALRLVRHPLTLLGLAGTVAATAASWDEPMLEARWRLLGFLLYPLLGGMFVAIHLAVARDRRTASEELTSSLPLGAPARTVGHLLAGLLVTVPLAGAWYAVVYARLGGSWSASLAGTGWSATWDPGVAELLQPLLIVATVLTIAVAAGRWWRHSVAAVLVPVLLLISPFLWLVPLMMQGGHYGHYETGHYVGEVTDGQLAWHLLFLVGTLGLAGTGALLRDRRRRGLVVAATLALVAVVVGFGLQQTVPPA